jgi:hypothetical protein
MQTMTKTAMGLIHSPARNQLPMTTVVIEDNSGQTSVLLSGDGDHIAVRFMTDNAGYEREITLPPDSFAWDRAVGRAKHAEAFCG